MWNALVLNYIQWVGQLENAPPSLEVNPENFSRVNFVMLDKLSFLYEHVFYNEQQRDDNDRNAFQSRGEGKNSEMNGSASSRSQASKNDSCTQNQKDHTIYRSTDYKAGEFKNDSRFQDIIKTKNQVEKRLVTFLQKASVENDMKKTYTDALCEMFAQIDEKDQAQWNLKIVNSFDNSES